MRAVFALGGRSRGVEGSGQMGWEDQGFGIFGLQQLFWVKFYYILSTSLKYLWKWMA